MAPTTPSARGTKPPARLNNSRPPQSRGRVSRSGKSILSRSMKVSATNVQVSKQSGKGAPARKRSCYRDRQQGGEQLDQG